MTRFTAAQKATKRAKAKTQKTTRVKREAMVEESKREQFLGLGMTCIHANGCAFRRDVAPAVLECHEFDIGQTAPAKIEAPARAETSTKGIQESMFKGLCVNCDVRHECKLTKPEEGVWHCEEYI